MGDWRGDAWLFSWQSPRVFSNTGKSFLSFRPEDPTLRTFPSNYEEAFHWEVTCLPSGGQCCNQHSLQRDWSSSLQCLGLSLLARVLASGEAIGEGSRPQLSKPTDLELTMLGSKSEESKDTVVKWSWSPASWRRGGFRGLFEMCRRGLYHTVRPDY